MSFLLKWFPWFFCLPSLWTRPVSCNYKKTTIVCRCPVVCSFTHFCQIVLSSSCVKSHKCLHNFKWIYFSLSEMDFCFKVPLQLLIVHLPCSKHRFYLFLLSIYLLHLCFGRNPKKLSYDLLIPFRSDLQPGTHR